MVMCVCVCGKGREGALDELDSGGDMCVCGGGREGGSLGRLA